MPNDGKIADRAHSAHLWVPNHMRRAKLRISVVFYVHADSKRILVGFPEEFPAPPGYLKVVCQTAAEVDKMSQLLRDQERRDEEMTDEQREAVEGPIRRHARQELHYRMMNSRNAYNREFCRLAIAKLDADEAKRKMKRESYMHVEGFEVGR